MTIKTNMGPGPDPDPDPGRDPAVAHQHDRPAPSTPGRLQLIAMIHAAAHLGETGDTIATVVVAAGVAVGAARVVVAGVGREAEVAAHSPR